MRPNRDYQNLGIALGVMGIVACVCGAVLPGVVGIVFGIGLYKAGTPDGRI